MRIKRFELLAGLLLAFSTSFAAAQVTTPNPIIFVTQFPIPNDFGMIGSMFSNHDPDMELTGRGGDLYIRYGDGTLRNLTREAGFGDAAVMQGANAISVRDPHVHWSGTRAIFSMVVGAPTQQHQQRTFYWQLYEVTGFGQGQTVRITKVPNQPTTFNNISPVYASDDQIIFVSDRSRTGERHLYPLHDEYESHDTNSGLWKLNPQSGRLQLMQFSPSGSFDPLVDSFGRVIFTRWDHLLRDQQNDAGTYGTFNYSSEAADSVETTDRSEVFPEPRLDTPNRNRFVINHFFPWEINQDGTGEETLNHVGRQELHRYFTRSFTNDTNLRDFEYTTSGRVNVREALNYMHLHEDAANPGRFYAVDAPEFGTQSAGQIIRIDAPPSKNPDDIVVDYVTHFATRSTAVAADNSGHYRNPIVLANGMLIAAHTPEQGIAGDDGTTDPDGTRRPNARYKFRLQRLTPGANGYQTASTPLTNGLSRHVSYWTPGIKVDYDGPFWELSPVEVVARPVPPASAEETADPETLAYVQTGVREDAFKAWLREKNLAVMVVRDATTRDDADKQQPFNLRVPGGRQTPANPTGRVYDIAHLQVMQGDQIRGIYRGGDRPKPGRRVLAQVMHEPAAVQANAFNSGGVAGSTRIASDGSVAMYVPASRALAWQTTAPDGTPVVRERYWITLQPGEVRACDGCHGVNRTSQAGQVASLQTAQAFIDLLGQWQANGDGLFSNGFE